MRTSGSANSVGGFIMVCGGDWCLFGYGRVFNFGALTCATVEALRDLGLAVIGGVDFGAFGARGFIVAGGRVVAELVHCGGVGSGGFDGSH
jgi:hypothetical protein